MRRQPSNMDSEVIYVFDCKMQVTVIAGGQAVMWCVTLNIYKRDFTSAWMHGKSQPRTTFHSSRSHLCVCIEKPVGHWHGSLESYPPISVILILNHRCPQESNTETALHLVCVYINIHTMYTITHVWYICKYKQTHKHVWIYIHTCINTHICIYKRVYAYINKHTYM